MKRCVHCAQPVDADDWSCRACGHRPAQIDGILTLAPDRASDESDFDSAGFSRLAPIEAGNYWFESRNRLIIWALGKYFPHGRSFFELGCGTGFVLSGVREACGHLAVSGGEMSLKGLTYASRRLPGVLLFQIDARRLPFDAEFDVVGSFDVLEHIADDERVLAEMFQATKPGGGVIVTVPQHPFLWTRLDEVSGHKRRYTRRDLIAKLERAGWRLVRVSSFVSVLWPLLVASRLTSDWRRGGGPPRAELEVGGVVNTLLGGALSLERILIQAGLSFPVGGSLLAVGVKP